MPIDVRKLIFTKPEIRLALQKYCKDKGMGVPEAPVQDVQVADSGNVTSEEAPEELKIILTYPSHDPRNPIRVHLREEQVLDALITLCLALKIPLPRRGSKTLQKHKDGLAINIALNEVDLRVARTG